MAALPQMPAFDLSSLAPNPRQSTLRVWNHDATDACEHALTGNLGHTAVGEVPLLDHVRTRTIARTGQPACAQGPVRDLYASVAGVLPGPDLDAFCQSGPDDIHSTDPGGAAHRARRAGTAASLVRAPGAAPANRCRRFLTATAFR
jgi:hypothetical protein